MIKIERYKNTRHWAVWHNEQLLAVVCYKKGAKAIEQVLTRRFNQSRPAADKDKSFDRQGHLQ